jgi:hypothetical protein
LAIKSLHDGLNVFFSWFCDVGEVVIIQKKHLAKFGYMSNM